MKRKGQISMHTAIMTTLIITVIVVSVIWGLLIDNTEVTAIANDSFTISNTSCVAVTPNCIQSLTSVTNSTTAVGIGNFSICSIGGEDQGITMDGTGATEVQYNGATVNATYTEQSCSYIGGTSGTLVLYIPLLMAVVIVAYLALMIK